MDYLTSLRSPSKPSFESLVLEAAAKPHSPPQVTGGFSSPRFRQVAILAEVLG